MAFQSYYNFSLGANLFGENKWYIDRKMFSITDYYLNKGLTSPFKILQIADLHDTQFGINNCFLTAAVKGIAPDIVLLTGDTVSAGGEYLEQTSRFLKEITTISPVFAILGNHERRKGKEEVISVAFLESGVILLKNELWQGEINGQKINILGLCEQQAITKNDYINAMNGTMVYENHDSELEELCRCDGLKILMSHFPENFALTGDCRYQRFNFDVMFAGHAHGGQFRLKKGVGLYAPGQGLFPLFTDGAYRHKNTRLIVSRGLGNNSPIPRINNKPEVVLLTIK